MNTIKTNRQHVIEIAANLFFVKGYHLTSMDEVVRESRVSKSNIYYHFKTKEELAIGILKWRISFLDQCIQEIQSNQAWNVQEKIMYLYQLFRDKNGEEGGCPLITLYLQASQQSKQIKKIIRGFFKDLFLSIEKIINIGIGNKEIKKDQEGHKLASFIVSSLEGSLLLSDITSDSQHLDHSLENVLNTI
ncbi:TetR/AcrR family transcriptional regulator [Bacillus sp. 2205SS5-2]|uniref:TetR/AcrR family transcriptional regulator n=1 Tax=Bacillus sp. 2205SS5-2 TaxID=3109031 RepID=UPI003007DEE6